MWSILAWAAFAAMLWFGWSAFALLRIAGKSKMNMVWLIGFWQLAAALGAFLVWRNGLGASLSFGGIVGLIIAGSNPLLWALGNVRNRLMSQGIRMNEVLALRSPYR